MPEYKKIRVQLEVLEQLIDETFEERGNDLVKDLENTSEIHEKLAELRAGISKTIFRFPPKRTDGDSIPIGYRE